MFNNVFHLDYEDNNTI